MNRSWGCSDSHYKRENAAGSGMIEGLEATVRVADTDGPEYALDCGGVVATRSDQSRREA